MRDLSPASPKIRGSSSELGSGAEGGPELSVSPIAVLAVWASAVAAVVCETGEMSKGPIAALALVLASGVRRQLRGWPRVPVAEALTAPDTQRCRAVGASAPALALRGLAPAARPVTASAGAAVGCETAAISKGPIAAVALVLASGVRRQLRGWSRVPP